MAEEPASAVEAPAAQVAPTEEAAADTPPAQGTSAEGAPSEVRPAEFEAFAESRPGEEQGMGKLHLLMDVPLRIAVELGRTRMSVREVLNLQEGAVVELHRPAGDPVDVYVNDRLMARGEVVVVDDCFAVRITEIVHAASRNGGDV